MSALVHYTANVASNVGTHIQNTTNTLIPPAQRDQKLQDLRLFANRNPKLATFLLAQILFLAIPTVLFTLFAVSTLAVSLTTSLFIAITCALIYTLLAVGIALCFLVPTLVIASCAATCFFLWGLAVYLVLQRFNEGEAPAKRGTRVGDTLHGLTGDRLAWLADSSDHKNGVDGAKANKEAGTGVKFGHRAVGHVNGAAEWEEKWQNGTQQRQTAVVDDLAVKF